MKKLHPTTTLGALFLLAALGCLMANQFIASLSLFVLAFFGATREVAIFTSKFQFTVVILAAMGLGISLDLRIPGFPFITIALMIAAGSSVLRISYFRFFSYTGYLWMELSMVAFAVLIFFAGSAVRTYDWIDYSFPSTILIFAFSFALNTLYDSIQLLRGSGAGFQIKAGQLARDFTLPDQNGVPVTLSHFKNDRTVLLIFVRGDWCPMCHMMLRTYDKRKEEFQQKNIMLLAIGPDPVGVNKAMVEKLGVDFRVLSDEAQQTARIYGVQIPEYKNNFAPKQPEGIPLPASFLLDKQQVVRYISSPAKVGEYLNPGLIFEVLKNISGLMSNFLVLITGGIFFLLSLYIFYKSRKSTAAAQLKLKENENFNSIINLANDAMLVIDIVDGRIHQVNPAACDLLGYSEKQLLGKTLFQLHPEEDLQRSSSVVADTWERGGLIYDDIPFLHASGGRVAVECSARVAPFAGRPAIVIYARDIRERLRLEAEIADQRRLIDEKSKDIHDSIEYSRRIQRSFLLDEKEIRFHQNEGFIFFQPRESVSGDFYWFINYVLNRQIISESGTVYEPGSRILAVAAVDCTGHGVPGAFISMIGNTLLEQTIRNENFRSPAAVLDHVNAGLKKHLNKNNDGSPLRDGMDMALCCIDFDGLQLEFAGANNPCYLIRNGNLMVLSAESQALTASTDIPVKPFSNQKVKLEKGDCLYLFSDGYADQFGGPRGKKFMSKKFKEYLLEIHLQPMDLQKTLLKETFEKWKGDLDQTDDVLVIGVRV